MTMQLQVQLFATTLGKLSTHKCLSHQQKFGTGITWELNSKSCNALVPCWNSSVTSSRSYERKQVPSLVSLLDTRPILYPWLTWMKLVYYTVQNKVIKNERIWKIRSTYVLQKHVQFWMRAGITGHLEQRTKQVVKQLFKVVDNTVQFVDITAQQERRLIQTGTSGFLCFFKIN